MISNAMTLSLLNFSYLAFGSLALAMFSHFRGVLNRSPSPTQSRLFYWFGWGVLAVSYYIGVLYQGFAYGSILFTGLLSLAGLLVILTLSYRAHQLPHFMAGSGVLGTLLLLFA